MLLKKGFSLKSKVRRKPFSSSVSSSSQRTSVRNASASASFSVICKQRKSVVGKEGREIRVG